MLAFLSVTKLSQKMDGQKFPVYVGLKFNFAGKNLNEPEKRARFLSIATFDPFHR